MLNRCFITYCMKKISVIKFTMIIWILDNFKTDNGFFPKLFKYSSKNDQVSKVLMLSITSNPDLNVYV